MRRFLKDTRGSAILWTLFLIITLFTLSAVIYTCVMVYAKYQTCETELQRAITVTVDAGLVNENVRDLQLYVCESAQPLLEDNLTDAGWTQGDDGWIRRNDEKIIYALEDIYISVEGKTLCIEATFVMLSPWELGSMTEIRIPMTVLSSALYIVE